MIPFKEIQPRGKGPDDSFEELCCQLARRTISESDRYERFRGDGGDGGVECIATDENGAVVGWQAKFVFSVDSLITQADRSFRTAVANYPRLEKFVLCYPFDPTGKTGRKKKDGSPAEHDSSKISSWIEGAEQWAEEQGVVAKIEEWPASRITSILLEVDSSGGIRRFFFSKTEFTSEWFVEAAQRAARAAEPRYSPDLKVQTKLASSLASFSQDCSWSDRLESFLRSGSQNLDALTKCINASASHHSLPGWPESLHDQGNEVIDVLSASFSICEELSATHSRSAFSAAVQSIELALPKVESLLEALSDEFDSVHGAGSSSSKRLRTFHAEYQAAFPAHNIDTASELTSKLREFYEWLSSSSSQLFFAECFVLTGKGGSGKTHGICDFALAHVEAGKTAMVSFGTQFNGEPDPGRRFCDVLGLPGTVSIDETLAALDAAGENSGTPCIIFIDAINETRPRDYWRNNLVSILSQIGKHDFLRVCLTCRTSFLEITLPPKTSILQVEHEGFKGMEWEACQAFFRHFSLNPPILPILQPELGNPLYLKLLCEALVANGMRDLPLGWSGLSNVIRAFLDEKETQFCTQNEGVSKASRPVAGVLMDLVEKLSESDAISMPWTEAEKLVAEKRPHLLSCYVIEWLVRNELLIEDGPDEDSGFAAEAVVRISFERFGDFLLADRLIQQSGNRIDKLFTAGGSLESTLSSGQSFYEQSGMLEALAVIVPERTEGELSNFFRSTPNFANAVSLVVQSLPTRIPSSFSEETVKLLVGHFDSDLAESMEAALAVSFIPSKLDAFWLNGFLRGFSMSQRDSFLTPHLHSAYEDRGVVWHFIETAQSRQLDGLTLDVAHRWAITLSWFGSCSDRRVKDRATRALVEIIRLFPSLSLVLAKAFIDVDDDDVLERVLLASYGALLIEREEQAVRQLVEFLLGEYSGGGNRFQNAIVRDLMRVIAELAEDIGVDLEFSPSEMFSDSIPDGDWPLQIPDEIDIDSLRRNRGSVSLMARSTISDDFNNYTIDCLSLFFQSVSKQDQCNWIVNHVVEEIGAGFPGADDFDEYITSRTGGGRSKATWAERIGKKYQWIALFRLASRLHDHAEKSEPYGPEPLLEPLILLEERKMDPSLLNVDLPNEKSTEWFWHSSGIPIPKSREDFQAWASERSDIPGLAELLEPREIDGKEWGVLSAFPGWSGYDSESGSDQVWCDSWLHLRGYLVAADEFEEARDSLVGRNYFNRWLPDAGKWLHGFAGEYPWGTAFNTEPDWYLGADGRVRGKDLKFIHASNEVVAEWSYDGSLPNSIYIHVPTKELFVGETLHWDGVGGFRNAKEAPVLRDPRFQFGGHPCLIGQWQFLNQHLERTGHRILWTLLGEKRILGDNDPDSPRFVHSQLGWLNNEQGVEVSDRVFFEDYEEKTGFG